MPEDPRQKLLEIAGQKFAERGFDGTNVREITEAAGMSVASVNYYFRSKEDLYIEAVRHAGLSCDLLTPFPEWGPEIPPETRLWDFIHVFLLRLLRTDTPPWHRLLIMREIAEPRPGACEAFVHSYVVPSFRILNAILAQLTPPDLPVEEIHLLGSSIVGQALHYHHARHVLPLLFEESPGYDIRRLTDHIWRFSLAAIRSLFPQTSEGRVL
ncbi:MAG: CerR family C-terminal domain-containing protein [Gemmataceae bacterium]